MRQGKKTLLALGQHTRGEDCVCVCCGRTNKENEENCYLRTMKTTTGERDEDVAETKTKGAVCVRTHYTQGEH